jgi:uncharacterized protein YjbI with pentapeptide repeats
MRIECQTGRAVDIPGGLTGVIEDLDVHRAVLERAEFPDTTFVRCSFRSALMSLSTGRGAKFVACTLILADFQGADLSDAVFDAGDAMGADFTGANLSRARFAGIRLDRAIFTGANLDAASLASSALGLADFRGALFTGQTRWPSGFDPSASGARLVAQFADPMDESF